MRRIVGGVLPRGRFGRAVMVLAGGSMLGQVIVLLVSPLLTRLYTPDDFGVLAVFGALLGMSGLAVCLRYEIAVPMAEDDATAANLVAVSLLAALLFSLAVGLMVALWGAAITGWVNAPALDPWLWLLPIGLFAAGCYLSFSHWAIRRQAFGRLTRTRITQSLGQAATQVGLGWFGAGPVGLLIGQVIGQSAGVTGLAAMAYRHERHLFTMIGPRTMARAAARFRRQPLFGTGAALLNGSARLLPALLIAALYGTQVAGWFALSQRVLGTPLRFLGSAVAQAYLGEAPRLAPTHAYALYMTTTRRLLAVGVLSLGVVVLAGPQLFAFVFGAAWSETGRYAQFLGLMYLGQLVVSPTSQTLMIMERQDLQLAWDMLRFVALLLIFWVGYELDWSALQTVAVLSVGMAVCYAVLFALTRTVLLSRLQTQA